jgi:hypothetical protein
VSDNSIRPGWRRATRGAPYDYYREERAGLSEGAAKWSVGIMGDRPAVFVYGSLFKVEPGWPGCSAAMEWVDREEPRPAPPPECGQVWRSHDNGATAMVVSVGADVVHFGGPAPDGPMPIAAWPPEGAHLISGPGAPWSPVEGA